MRSAACWQRWSDRRWSARRRNRLRAVAVPSGHKSSDCYLVLQLLTPLQRSLSTGSPYSADARDRLLGVTLRQWIGRPAGGILARPSQRNLLQPGDPRHPNQRLPGTMLTCGRPEELSAAREGAACKVHGASERLVP